MDLAVDGFTVGRLEQLLSEMDEIHFSEVSIYEAKAKIHRLSLRNEDYRPALAAFGENLQVLREDEKVRFRQYTLEDDHRFNHLADQPTSLDVFDMVIVAQAAEAGRLLTEDHEILGVRDAPWLRGHPMQGLRITSWREASEGLTR